MKTQLTLIFALFFSVLCSSSSVHAADDFKTFDLWRHASTYDQSQQPDRDRKNDAAKNAGDPGLVRGNSDWLSYDFELQESGWYELYLLGTPLGWRRDIELDGKRIFKGVLRDDAFLTDKNSPAKVRSLYIEKGKHTLKYTMAAFPGLYLHGWGLIKANSPAQSIYGELQSNSIGRISDVRQVQLTFKSQSFEQTLTLTATEDISKQTFTLGQFKLKANTTSQAISFRLPQQGSYQLAAKLDDQVLQSSDLALPLLGAIDTTPVTVHQPTVKKTLLWDIDCVKQTRNGKPVKLDETFWEANGPTRIHRSPAGTYRESDALSGDNQIVSGHGERSLNAFSYAIDVPEIQVPYLLEVDYPDDTRRTTNVVILEKAIIHPRHGYPMAQLGSGYETGDAFELTNEMKTHRVYFWPTVPEIRAALVSIYDGQRAAAARIRVYKLDEGLPDPVKPYAGPKPGGRVFASYYEEWRRWNAHQRSAYLAGRNEMSQDIIGIDRWLRLSRAVGMNAISPTEVVYRSCTYDSDALYGYGTQPYDIPRLAVLLAEKYQMGYSPELHVTPRPTLDNLVKAQADKPEDTLLYSQTGAVGIKNNYGPGFNPLHPAVQDRYLMILDELVSKLGDSPAYDGVNIRLMTWAGNSWFWLCSLNWGYGDWTINQFEKDTGIDVPTPSGDQSLQRFSERYTFLTSKTMVDRWIAWRNGRMLQYIRKMRDVVTAANPDARLIFTGSYELDYIFEHDPDATPQQLLTEAGFDLEALSQEHGIGFVNVNAYGRAKTASPVEDQAMFDKLIFNDKRLIAGGNGQIQKVTNTYFEVHERVPVDRLGLPGYTPKGYCGAAEAAGRMGLRKLAIPLAEQDTLRFVQGGLGYVWGQPDVYVPWLNAFTALPAVAFDEVASPGDAVVVRQKTLENKGYGYVVNREPFAVDVTLTVNAKQLERLGTGEKLPVTNGKLTLQLQPFELISFKSQDNATIIKVSMVIPQERIDLLKNRLAQCQQWQMQMQDGALADALNDQQKSDYANILAKSWQAFSDQRYWHARHLLGSQTMLAIYQTIGRLPVNQLGRDFPMQLTVSPTGKYEPANPALISAAQLLKQAKAASTPQCVDSASINPDWGGDEVLLVDNQVQLGFDVPFAGKYRIALGHVRDRRGAMMASLNGKSLPILANTKQPNVPEQTAFGMHALKAGDAQLSLQGTGQIGVYALNIEPVYYAVSSEHWQVLGPFPSAWYSSWQKNAQQAIHDAMQRIDPPMNPLDLNARYENAFGQSVGWTTGEHCYSKFSKWGVNFLTRIGITEGYISFAVTHILSPEDRQAQLLIGSDWWSNAYLNGKLVESDRKPENVAKDGAMFNGWKPTSATIELKKGVNALLVKHHGGSAATWFTAFITNPGDLQITAEKPVD